MAQSAGLFVSNGEATIRSSVYKSLSRMFRYPSPEFFDACRTGTLLADLRKNLERLALHRTPFDEEAGLSDRLQETLEGITYRDFEVGYTQTFDVGAPKPPCPPYAGVHRQGVERTHVMVEISELYRHFGLNMNPEEGRRELPDHLSAELEFLHFLTFKEAQAMGERTRDLLKGYILAQKDFLERHMVSWLPGFCEKLERSARVPLYGGLAGVTLGFVTSDLEWTHLRWKELDQP